MKLRDAYMVQRYSAIHCRDIQFDLTFEQWLDIWERSGHLSERGRGAGKYCMSRINDTGPYAVGNVFIQSHTENQRDGVKGKKQSPTHIARKVFSRINGSQA